MNLCNLSNKKLYEHLVSKFRRESKVLNIDKERSFTALYDEIETNPLELYKNEKKKSKFIYFKYLLLNDILESTIPIEFSENSKLKDYLFSDIFFNGMEFINLVLLEINILEKQIFLGKTVKRKSISITNNIEQSTPINNYLHSTLEVPTLELEKSHFPLKKTTSMKQTRIDLKSLIHFWKRTILNCFSSEKFLTSTFVDLNTIINYLDSGISILRVKIIILLTILPTSIYKHIKNNTETIDFEKYDLIKDLFYI